MMKDAVLTRTAILRKPPGYKSLTVTERAARRRQTQHLALRRAALDRFRRELLERDKCSTSYLEANAVKPSTLKDYIKRTGEFAQWCQQQPKQPNSPQELDKLLVQWFDAQYALGKSSGDGSKLIASLQNLHPRLRAEHLLPRAARAIKGWRRLVPPHSRPPVPWLAVTAMIGALHWLSHPATAFGMLIQFVCYLRPGELVGLTPSHVVRPTAHAGPYAKRWGLLLGPQALGVPTKPGEFDQSVLIDWSELHWIGPLMEALLKDVPAQQTLFNLSGLEYNALLRLAARVTGSDILDPQPYGLRHGGASMDILTSRRSLSEVKKRGRWKTDASVRRYEKATLALKQLARLAPETIEYGKLIEKHMAAIFLGTMEAPPPPRSTLAFSA